MIQELELRMMQLNHYFITKQGYQVVHVQGMQEERWLFHRKHKNFPMIRIVSGAFSEEELPKVQQVKRAIEASIGKTGTALNIHFDELSYDLEEVQNIKTIGINPSYHAGLLESYFKDINQVFVRHENADEAYIRYKAEIDRTLKARVRRRWFPISWDELPKVSAAFAAACVLIWIASMILKLQFGEKQLIPIGIALGSYYRVLLAANQEYWRFFTAGLVHLDFFHLLLNVISLLNIGIMVERYYGPWRYLGILSGSMILATAIAHMMPNTILLMGISGGVYGAFGALIVLLVKTKAIQNPQVMRQLGNVIIINLIINFLPEVSVSGHLGGFLGGVILGILLAPGKDWLKIKLHTALASLVFIGFLGYQLRKPIQLLHVYGETDVSVMVIYDKLGLHDYALQLFQKVNQFYIEGNYYEK